MNVPHALESACHVAWAFQPMMNRPLASGAARGVDAQSPLLQNELPPDETVSFRRLREPLRRGACRRCYSVPPHVHRGLWRDQESCDGGPVEGSAALSRG